MVLDRGECFEGDAIGLWYERRGRDGRLCHRVIDIVRRGKLTHVVAMMDDTPQIVRFSTTSASKSASTASQSS